MGLLRTGALTLAFALAGLGACGDEKKAKSGETEAATDGACTTNADCENGWVCLSNQCADPTLRGLGSGNGVTSEKVKKHVEDIGKKADERGQKALDL